jgi:D-alanyl-D-alanine carboxypeptidase (penicillin-binding protein 5/6)
VTARDLAHLAKATIQDHPQLYKQFYSRTSYTWGKTLGAGDAITRAIAIRCSASVAGADGLKTGHTDEAGYGFTGSADQNGRRLVMVVAGLEHLRPARRGIGAFMQWGFRAWQPAADRVEGQEDRRGRGAGRHFGQRRRGRAARPDRDRARRHRARDAGAHLVYLGPVPARFKAGDHIADLVVDSPGMPTQTLPLVAEADVGEAGFFRPVPRAAGSAGRCSGKVRIRLFRWERD